MTNLILLHGALGSKQQCQNIAQLMPTNITTHNLNFPEHGTSKEAINNYTIDGLASWVALYISTHQLQNCVLLGYSLGGYVALWLAAKKPQNISKVITLATKFDWNQAIIDTEIEKLTIENLLPIKEKLETEHGQHFETLLPHTHQILSSIANCMLNQSVLATVECPVLLLVGDKDKMVGSQETQQHAAFMPNAKVNILAEQPHLIHKMNAELIANKVQRFLNP